MRTFVVPDLHGRHVLARELLYEAGIVDGRGARINFESRTVQLGDLANCVARDRDADLAILRHAARWFDVLIVGNHEYPYLGGGSFSGFWRFHEVERRVNALTWTPALAVGETLLTHAGVHGMIPMPERADDAEAVLRAAWQHDIHHPWFRQIGRARGGQAEFGGVLWRDARGENFLNANWNQVHGHTPIEDGPIVTEWDDGWAVNLDCGGHGDVRRLVGLWLDQYGECDGLVEVDLADSPVRA